MTNSRQSISTSNNRGKTVIAVSLVFLITILVYLPSLRNGFVNWDDPEYVYNNPYIRSLDFTSIKWAFTSFHSANWHPLTWLSHAMDYAIWGLDPIGHHLTSALLHGLNTILVVFLVIRLVSIVSPANQRGNIDIPLTVGLVTGVLFGLHPLHVESVAWVSERKDVLYAFFFLLSIISYLKFATYPSSKTRNYILCLLFFVLSLMSKPMAVTLPVVLLLLDLYPLERLSLKKTFSLHRTVLIEKIPFVFLSAASCMITMMAQQKAMPSLELFPFGTRIYVGIRALGFYLTKMIFPSGLAPFYPHPREISFLSADYIVMLFLVTAIVISCFWLIYKKRNFWPAAWAYYLVTLLPVLGIIQVGEQAAADRYIYLPSLGPFILAGLGVTYVLSKVRKENASVMWRSMAGLFLLLVLGIMCTLTVKQAAIWKDSMTLWSTELKIFPDSSKAYFTIGNYHYDKGSTAKAVEYFNRAIEIDPLYARAYYDRALAYEDSGNYQLALRDYSMAISANPGYQLAYINRGVLHARRGKYQNAITDFSRGIVLNPKDPFAFYNRGLVYELSGNRKDAYNDFQVAAKLGNNESQNRLKMKSMIR